MRGNTTGYYASAIGGCEAPLLRRYLSGDTLKATIEGFSSGVKKLYSDVKVDENYGDKFGPTGSLSTWFDFMVTDDGSSLTSSGITKDACDMSAEEDLHLAESAPRTRKVQKLASKDCIHGLHDLDMDVMMPYIMDDKRKRRMNSNRASAQRSRQRKQERLDELEVLTAQLRLENACLRRKSNMAVQLAEKYEEERSMLARKVVELEKQVVKGRETSSDTVKDSGDDSVTTQQTRTHVDNKVDERTGGAPTDGSTELSSAAPGATSGGPPLPARYTTKLEEHPAACIKKLGVDVAGDNHHPAVPQQETFFRDFYDAIQSEIYDFTIDADEADADEARDDWMDTFAGSMNTSPSYLGAVVSSASSLQHHHQQ
jgi:hypothetical protein